MHAEDVEDVAKHTQDVAKYVEDVRRCCQAYLGVAKQAYTSQVLTEPVDVETIDHVEKKKKKKERICGRWVCSEGKEERRGKKVIVGKRHQVGR